MNLDKTAIQRAFKAYDVRGKIPSELNEDVLKKIGNCFARFIGRHRGKIVIGYDVRPTSEPFARALTAGVTDAGVNVLDIGLVGTDMVYHAAAYYHCDGGVMITASHNPADYNGLKFVRESAIAISEDSGLRSILTMVLNDEYAVSSYKGRIEKKSSLNDYLNHILSFISLSKISKLKIVLNGGNGCAGIVLPELMKRIPQIKSVPVFWTLDGSFPNGIPNPLLPERREETAKKVRESKAHLGVAWDGDFDRCFFYDEEGTFVEGYYIVALFGEHFSRRERGAKIIHDPRLVWATREAVTAAGGTPIQCKAGHAFIKERMRVERASYAGEMSAHHYFHRNYYADNGMIPFLLLLEILSERKTTLKNLVQEWTRRFPVSGEVNIFVKNPQMILKKIEEVYSTGSKEKESSIIDHTDGVSIEFPRWRMNLRISNTEPVIRLNVEARNERDLMEKKRDEILQIISNLDKSV
ncbi:MAG TPA: phosphomannomutase/phosphoglucomutase [Candidatus Hodarchaeales archaeon]|nr:phosphomannomutase/phosphoglucomutase [Candidatus Hodarchaeales archaeon]